MTSRSTFGTAASFKRVAPLLVVAVTALGLQGGALADAPQKKGEPAKKEPAKKDDPTKLATVPLATMASGDRWVAATPDEMVDSMFARAKKGGPDALAAIVVAASLDD